ncbi:MAG: hypothetical protein H8E37_07500 [Planctomycetes bacterium]|nr:hypothetical protein [Planctomycetota bacterium]
MKNRRQILSPLILSFLLTVPIGFAVALGAGLSHEAWREIRRDWFGETYLTTRNWKRLQMTADGTPLVETTQFGGQWQDTYTHIDGSSPTDPETKLIRAVNFSQTDHLRPHLPFSDDPLTVRLRRANPNGMSRYLYSGGGTYSWHFVRHVDDRSRFYLLVRNRNRNQQQFASRVGLTEKLPRAEDCFSNPQQPIDSYETLAFKSDGGLFLIQLQVGVMTRIEGDDIQHWAITGRGGRVHIATLHEHSLRVTDVGDTKPRLLNEWTFPESVDVTRAEFFELEDGQWAAISQEMVESTPREGRTIHVSQARQKAWLLDADGEVTWKGDFGAVWRTHLNRAESGFVSKVDSLVDVGGPGIVLPEPLSMAVFHLTLLPLAFSADASWAEEVAAGFTFVPLAMPIALVSGLLGAVLCYRRQKKYEASHTAVWVTFVFLFGLPGYFGWRVHRTWPHLEVAGLTDTDINAPEPNGLEVFA